MSDPFQPTKPSEPPTERLARAAEAGAAAALRAQAEEGAALRAQRAGELAQVHVAADARDAAADAALGAGVRSGASFLTKFAPYILAGGGTLSGLGVGAQLSDHDKGRFDAMGTKLDTLSGKLDALSLGAARMDARTDARLNAVEAQQRVFEDRFRDLERERSRKRD